MHCVTLFTSQYKENSQCEEIHSNCELQHDQWATQHPITGWIACIMGLWDSLQTYSSLCTTLKSELACFVYNLPQSLLCFYLQSYCWQPTYLLFWIWNMKITISVCRTFCVLLFPKSELNWVKKPQMFSAPTTWSNLQNDLKLQGMVTLNECKTMSPGCLCVLSNHFMLL